MGGARWLLSSGLLGSDDTRRTVRDWVVDLADLRRRGRRPACTCCARRGSSTRPRSRRSTSRSGASRCAALWWRRERPGTVALIAIPLAAVSALAAMAPLPALFNAAIRLPLRTVALLTALSVALSPVFALLYPDVEGRGDGLAGRRRPAADRGRARVGAVRARAARARARPARARPGRGARGRAAADRARDARRARAPALDPVRPRRRAGERAGCRRSTRRPRT